jgi:hypothetical protein
MNHARLGMAVTVVGRGIVDNLLSDLWFDVGAAL